MILFCSAVCLKYVCKLNQLYNPTKLCGTFRVIYYNEYDRRVLYVNNKLEINVHVKILLINT